MLVCTARCCNSIKAQVSTAPRGPGEGHGAVRVRCESSPRSRGGSAQMTTVNSILYRLATSFCACRPAWHLGLGMWSLAKWWHRWWIATRSTRPRQPTCVCIRGRRPKRRLLANPRPRQKPRASPSRLPESSEGFMRMSVKARPGCVRKF